jgi:diguanylate cyclase (GGDEF)-like protein
MARHTRGGLLTSEPSNPRKASSALRDVCYEDRLAAAKRLIRMLAPFIALFNALLIIPDMLLLAEDSARLGIVALRICFTLLMAGMFLFADRFKRFSSYALAATGCEALGVLIFLHVYNQYETPDFFIQTLGLLTLILVIFLVPNRIGAMISLSVLAASFYLLIAMLHPSVPSPMWAVAAGVYLAVDIVISALFAYNTEKHALEEFKAKREMLRMSTIDHLTLIPNRFKLEDEAEKWMDFCRRHHLPLSVIFLDVDELKDVNDRHGHLAGDSVLSGIAALILSECRREDVVARWGGDEFAVLLPCIPYLSAVRFAERIRKAIEGFTFCHNVRTTCSLGVVAMNAGETFSDMIQAADKLMYEAKRRQKNTVAWRHDGAPAPADPSSS